MPRKPLGSSSNTLMGERPNITAFDVRSQVAASLPTATRIKPQSSTK